MYLAMILQLFTLHIIFHQVVGSCVCELINAESPFPHDKLNIVEKEALQCNKDINPQKIQEFDTLLSALETRLPRLVAEVSDLEKENDGELYGAIALQVIQNDMAEIQQLLNKLNDTHSGLHLSTSQKLQGMKGQLQQLEVFDTTQTVKRQKTNIRLKRDLDQCTHGSHPTPAPVHGACPHGQLLNVTGPRVHTAGEYPGSYKYGAWGRDPKPAVGKEKWYWLVILTSSNVFSHYVRRYTTLSALILGISTPGNVIISNSNPTTNTIQGPNVVLYGEALYYNCYNIPAVCRFNLTAKTVKSTELPKGTRFNSKGNFCHLEACYPYTDMDLATDETGVWVVYTTAQDLGNLVLSQVEGGGEEPTLGTTWRTTVYKTAVTNTFVACGVLYATRYISKDVEEIFYSLDTVTGVERYDVGIYIAKLAGHIYSLNYSPVDQMLHAYGEAFMTSYKVVFG